MADLTGKKIANTYKNLLQVDSPTDEGVENTLRRVQDGEGENTALEISTNKAKVNGNFTVTGEISASTFNLSELVAALVSAENITVGGDGVATSSGLATVSAALETRITGVSSTLAATSATLESRIADTSIYLQTDINSVSANLVSTSAALQTNINTVSATLSTTNVALQTSIANVSATLETRIAGVSSALQTNINTVSAGIDTVSAGLDTANTSITANADAITSINSKIATVSSALATSIANVSATLETRIATVSSTLESRAATLSSTMATSIANVSAGLQTQITVNTDAITSINTIVNDVNASAIAANAQDIALANTSIAANASTVALNLAAITSVNTLAVAAMPKAGGTFTGEVIVQNDTTATFGNNEQIKIYATSTGGGSDRSFMRLAGDTLNITTSAGSGDTVIYIGATVTADKAGIQTLYTGTVSGTTAEFIRGSITSANIPNLHTSIVSAQTYYGDGSNLTGIVAGASVATSASLETRINDVSVLTAGVSSTMATSVANAAAAAVAFAIALG